MAFLLINKPAPELSNNFFYLTIASSRVRQEKLSELLFDDRTMWCERINCELWPSIVID